MLSYNHPDTRKIAGAPVTMVNVLQSLIAYANPANAMDSKKKPTHTIPPAMPLWRIPQNSVNSTNSGML